MNRAPLSKEPVNLSILLKMAYTDSFALGLASTFAGAAISEIRPESIILGFIGLMFLYFFISDYTDENEISVLKKNINWFNAYSFVTYISVAIVGFFIHFELLAFVAIVALFPALINAGLVRPFITVSIYKTNYNRLFGFFDA
ncbi:MAG: hypothetical protein GY695_14985 [Aestuariibacter sp.]|uniref:hypothetical protein n=1 Tax=Marisediminitalea aggregata TaxID=634436 RepID=UPI0020CC1C4C|nr:hypothetical protein [Marisediminitalea aggregata]MCP3864418.1 hypothetical protein [Aestuariibacter sp.]MCP4527575.1 hypothetical protein [Aestuariibacter sp.]MCP9478875.1 hypothetical protein [Marisediminitalea aggregata]